MISTTLPKIKTRMFLSVEYDRWKMLLLPQFRIFGPLCGFSLAFAGAALLLAAIGIYGLMSYWVGQRTYEIGLRVAIGATRGRIVSMIVTQGLRVSLYGVVGGFLTALVLTRFLASLLYGVAATDMLTFAAVTMLILGVAVIATAFPAWRAARIDPAKSLRAE
ncbi:MAG: FtsX-like permease family protein [Acidobacteriaceae bacterium]|nr:FtsX-like permease family protein [Acidobacteriaceae bacterium]